MKYLVCLALVCVGCSENQTSPSAVLSASATPVAVSGPTAGPVPTAGNPVVSGMIVTGPSGCRTAEEFVALPFNQFVWDVTISDAGAGGFEGFLAMAHSSPRPVGMSHYDVCVDAQGKPKNYIENPRPRITLSSQNPPLPLGPHRSGTYHFAAPSNEIGCGWIYQGDISARPGRDTDVIISLVVDYGDCPPGTPKPPSVPPLDPPVIPPTAPPANRTPPLVPPVAVCYPTKDLFLGKVHKQQVGNEVIFEYSLNPAYPNAEITIASYQKTTGQWLPQSLIPGVSPLTFNAGLSQSARIAVASCGAQVDIYFCAYAPNPLTDANIADASLHVVDFWDDSPACPGTLKTQARWR